MAGRVGGYKTPLEYDNRARSRRRRAVVEFTPPLLRALAPTTERSHLPRCARTYLLITRTYF